MAEHAKKAEALSRLYQRSAADLPEGPSGMMSVAERQREQQRVREEREARYEAAREAKAKSGKMTDEEYWAMVAAREDKAIALKSIDGHIIRGRIYKRNDELDTAGNPYDDGDLRMKFHKSQLKNLEEIVQFRDRRADEKIVRDDWEENRDFYDGSKGMVVKGKGRSGRNGQRKGKGGGKKSDASYAVIEQDHGGDDDKGGGFKGAGRGRGGGKGDFKGKDGGGKKGDDEHFGKGGGKDDEFEQKGKGKGKKGKDGKKGDAPDRTIDYGGNEWGIDSNRRWEQRERDWNKNSANATNNPNLMPLGGPRGGDHRVSRDRQDRGRSRSRSLARDKKKKEKKKKHKQQEEALDDMIANSIQQEAKQSAYAGGGNGPAGADEESIGRIEHYAEKDRDHRLHREDRGGRRDMNMKMTKTSRSRERRGRAFQRADKYENGEDRGHRRKSGGREDEQLQRRRDSRTRNRNSRERSEPPHRSEPPRRADSRDRVRGRVVDSRRRAPGHGERDKRGAASAAARSEDRNHRRNDSRDRRKQSPRGPPRSRRDEDGDYRDRGRRSPEAEQGHQYRREQLQVDQEPQDAQRQRRDEQDPPGESKMNDEEQEGEEEIDYLAQMEAHSAGLDAVPQTGVSADRYNIIRDSRARNRPAVSEREAQEQEMGRIDREDSRERAPSARRRDSRMRR